MEIAKAEESLKAAEICHAQGLYNSSASRAYYAMFQGAQVALEAADYRAHDLGKRQALRALNKARRCVNSVKERIFHG